MNDKIIEQHLASYYNGTATDEEIRTLEAFFSHTDVPAQWKDEQQLFLQLRSSETIPLPDGLEARLEKSLDAHIAGSKRIHLSRMTYKIAGVAATVLLCIGIAVYQNSFNTPSEMTADTYQDPQEAALVAGQALAFLSSNLNKGMEQLSDAQKDFQEVNEILNKQIK
jgi:hypothetical protein